jgi:hypothetical protein
MKKRLRRLLADGDTLKPLWTAEVQQSLRDFLELRLEDEGHWITEA